MKIYELRIQIQQQSPKNKYVFVKLFLYYGMEVHGGHYKKDCKEMAVYHCSTPYFHVSGLHVAKHLMLRDIDKVEALLIRPRPWSYYEMDADLNHLPLSLNWKGKNQKLMGH